MYKRMNISTMLKMRMCTKKSKINHASAVQYLDMHIYTTHLLKLGRDQRSEKKREWLFLVIYTFDIHIYTTHLLKLGMDQRKEKKRVVIPSH